MRSTQLVSRTVFTLGLLVLTAVPVVGRQMGSYSIYSDSWLNSAAWSEEADPSLINVVSCGVTQDTWNSYGHRYWVVTTLRSPGGRAASTTSYTTNSFNAYTRAETALSLDTNELDNENGTERDFVTESQHYISCPYMGNYPYYYQTGYNFPLGIRFSSYQFAGIENDRCLWQRTCTGLCTAEHSTNMFNGACYTAGRIYRHCGDLTSYGICVAYRVVCAGSIFPGICT